MQGPDDKSKECLQKSKEHDEKLKLTDEESGNEVHRKRRACVGKKEVDTANAIRYYNVEMLVNKEVHHTATKDEPCSSESGSVMVNQSRNEGIQVSANIPQEDQQNDVELDDNFSAKDLLSFAWQIAKGMVSAEMTAY